MRNEALSFTVVTGHEDPTGSDPVNWEAIARTGGTIVILMGVARIASITHGLLAGGLAPDTPAACVRWGTTERQQVVRTTLVALPHDILSSPSVIVVGEAARHHFSWPPHTA
jgi:siroheme synthase